MNTTFAFKRKAFMTKTIFTTALLFLITLLSAQSIEELEQSAGEKMSNADYVGALTDFKKAIELISEEGSHSTTYAYAGMCAKELGENALAKEYFTESVKRGIEEPMIFDELAAIAKKEKDYATQIMAYQAGVERSPADLQKYQLKLCSVYKKQKDGAQLLSAAEAILAYDAQNTKALEYKGTALQYQKNMKEAYAVFQELYAADPENINANIFLGNYSYQVGKSKLAAARKKYDAIPNPTRVQWHENNEKSMAIMEKYYRPAIGYMEYVYSEKPSSSVKKMLFTMYTKLGEKEKATLYK